MSKVYMMIGIAGCGKSTYARKHFGNAEIISSDEIRKEFYGSEEIQTNPKKVFAEVHRRIKTAIENDKDVVVDATNLKAKYRKSIIEIAIGCEVIAVYLDTELQTAINRNAQRKRKVPEEVIAKMYNQIELPQYKEGFSEIKFIINT